VKVILEKKASRYLDKLDAARKGQILAALKALANDPPAGDIKPLQGKAAGIQRLRIGAYRAIFRTNNDVIIVSYIGPRGQAYKKHNRKQK
jgi:mRNA interferase RelE/StbE